MNEIKDELRPRLKEYVRLVTKPDPKAGRDMYACPVCGSGSKGDRSSDGAFHLSGETWYCHSCQNGGDIFALYAGLHNLDTKTDFPQILEGLQKELGVTVVEPVKREVTPEPKEVKEDVKQIDQERMTQIETFAAALPGSPGEAYLKDRGFSNEIISQYKLGYDREKDAVVIPYPGTDYFTKRLIHPGNRNKYDKIKGVESPTFIIKTSPSDTYVMTEGELDSLSNLQAGAHNVIASHYPNRIMDLLEETKVDGVVIVGDRDPDSKRIPEKGNKTPGESEAETMEKLFMEKGIPAVVVYPPEGFKDSNDLLKVDPNQLTELIAYGTQKLQELIEKKQKDDKEQSAAESDPWDDLEPISIVNLLEMDIPELYFPVKDMIPEGLSYIGAAPKSGKSWLMMDLCISVATGKPFLGHETQQSDCIYFDLENPDIGLKTRLQKMVTDNPLPENVRVVFSDQILKKVKGDAFPRLDSGFDVILERMIQKNPKARLIIIDTLAHISARRLRNEDPIDKDSRNGLILKRIAEKYHVAIVVVTHTTKMKYDENIFNNISGTSGVTAMSNLNMVLMKENKNSPVSILACQERYAENHIYNMRFDQNCLRWIYLGEAAGEPGDREEQQKLEEFLSSDIRKAVKEICEKDFNGYKGSVTGFIEKASAYGIGVPETRKHIGMFLSENIGKFAKYDGITITATSNGNAGRTYSMRLWRPEGQNSDNSQ